MLGEEEGKGEEMKRKKHDIKLWEIIYGLHEYMYFLYLET